MLKPTLSMGPFVYGHVLKFVMFTFDYSNVVDLKCGSTIEVSGAVTLVCNVFDNGHYFNVANCISLSLR